MIRAPKSMRELNSFQFVAIPTPRDIFNRFGFGKASENFSNDGTEIGEIAVQPRSIIGQMVRCQNDLENFGSK